jgi:hypothetical protein
MLTRQPFISVLVVACHPGHELLCIVFRSGCDLGQEVLGFMTSQCRGEAAVMKDLHVLVLPGPVLESKIAHGLILLSDAHREQPRK